MMHMLKALPRSAYSSRPISIHKWNKSSGNIASSFPWTAQIGSSDNLLFFMIKIIGISLFVEQEDPRYCNQ